MFQINGYCDYSAASGFYWLHKPPPFGLTQVWCDFQTREEMYAVVVDETPLSDLGTNPKKLPALAKEFRLTFQLNMQDMGPVFQLISQDGNMLVGLVVRKDDAYYKTKQHALHVMITKTTPGQMTGRDSEPANLQVGTKWNDLTIAKRQVGGAYGVDVYVNSEKVMDFKPFEDCPVFNNVTVTTGHGDVKIPNPAHLRNFYLYNKF